MTHVMRDRVRPTERLGFDDNFGSLPIPEANCATEPWRLALRPQAGVVLVALLGLALALGGCGSDGSDGGGSAAGDDSSMEGASAGSGGSGSAGSSGSGAQTEDTNTAAGAAGMAAPTSTDGSSGTGDTGTGGTGGAEQTGDSGTADAGTGSQQPVANADGSDGCEPGELLDTNDSCVPACELVSCGDHGSCELNTADEVVCSCDDGWTGDACDSCAAGYATDPTGACVEKCELLDCGFGRCYLEGDTATCACRENYVGDNCEQCAPGYDWSIVLIGETSTCELSAPATTGMRLWLDADADDSLGFYLTSNDLQTWSSLVGTNIDFAAPAGANRPLHGLVREGDTLPGVIFDGVDDTLEESFSLGNSSYSIYIVAEVADKGYEQTILSGVSGGKLGIWLSAANGGTSVKMRHRNPDGSGADDLELTGVDLKDRTLIEVHRAGLGLSVEADGGKEQKVLSTEPLGTLDFALGRRPDSGNFPMQGAIYEVIVVAPAVPSGDRPDYSGYLKAKWELP
ncbi:MAG: hypothetical protein OEZ06_31480 [Myxococcales bacterium]|nr:hypothetical protein [Myxococcales bacterium]